MITTQGSAGCQQRTRHLAAKTLTFTCGAVALNKHKCAREKSRTPAPRQRSLTANASEVWEPGAGPPLSFSTTDANDTGHSFGSLNPAPARVWTTADGTQGSWALDTAPINQQILIDHIGLDQRAPNFTLERAVTNNNFCIYRTGQHTKHFQMHYALSVPIILQFVHISSHCVVYGKLL